MEGVEAIVKKHGKIRDLQMYGHGSPDGDQRLGNDIWLKEEWKEHPELVRRLLRCIDDNGLVHLSGMPRVDPVVPCRCHEECDARTVSPFGDSGSLSPASGEKAGVRGLLQSGVNQVEHALAQRAARSSPTSYCRLASPLIRAMKPRTNRIGG